MNSQFSPKLSIVLAYSREEALRLQNSFIGPEHLLLGIIRDGDGRAIDVLKALSVDLQRVKRDLELNLRDQWTSVNQDEVNLNEEASRLLRLSTLEARLYRSDQVYTEHVLLAMLKEKNNMVAKILENSEINYTQVVQALNGTAPEIRPQMGFGLDDDDEEDDGLSYADNKHDSVNGDARKQSATTTRQTKSSNDTPVIDSFGIDMTRAAAEGKLDPVVGREKEIERLAQILSRRKKNNPVLIGEPGVGKSAIVEGLALRIVQRKVSRLLFDKRVVALDIVVSLKNVFVLLSASCRRILM